MPLAGLLAGFQSLPLLPISKLGPSGVDSLRGGFVYLLDPVGLSNKLCPMKLGVSPAASTPTDFFSQRF